MQKNAQKRDAAAPQTGPLPRRGARASVDAVARAAAHLGADASPGTRIRSSGASDAATRCTAPLFAALSSRAAPPPPAASDARRGGFGPISLLLGGARLTLGAAGSVAGLALLPLRLLPLPRKRTPAAPAAPGGGGARGVASSASAPLSREAREKAGHALRVKASKEELQMLWSYTNAAERARVTDFFAAFASPKWRLEEIRDNGTEARPKTQNALDQRSCPA